MRRYRITCVDHDQNGVITQVGIETNSGAKKYDIDTVADYIDNNRNTFYTRNSSGRFVRIYTGANLFKRYLTTDKDSPFENNLDFLPHCKYMT